MRESNKGIFTILIPCRPQELSELDRKRKSLELALQEFLKSVQNQYPDDTSPKFDSWEDVTEVVQKMIARLEQKQSKGKFRRATKHLRSFCNTVKYHSTALKMLPTNNEYVSVFYGALATTIQVRLTSCVSVRYSQTLNRHPRTTLISWRHCHRHLLT